MSGNWGGRYSMAELLRLEAANTLTGATRWRAVADLAAMSGRPKSAVREMANKMRQGRSALLLERCRAEQAERMMAMVPDRGRGANDGRWSKSQAVVTNKIVAHSGGELTENENQQ